VLSDLFYQCLSLDGKGPAWNKVPQESAGGVLVSASPSRSGVRRWRRDSREPDRDTQSTSFWISPTQFLMGGCSAPRVPENIHQVRKDGHRCVFACLLAKSTGLQRLAGVANKPVTSARGRWKIKHARAPAKSCPCLSGRPIQSQRAPPLPHMHPKPAAPDPAAGQA